MSSEPSSPARPWRIDALDALRGLAALAVLVRHTWMFSGKPGGFWGGVWEACDLGVPLFFVLSGFLLWGPWARAARRQGKPPVLTRYLARRAARVLPGYWLALAGGIVILAGTGHPQQIPSLEWLPAYLLFIQNYIPQIAGTVDPPMWTLLIEVSFYLALIPVGLTAFRLGPGRRQYALLAALAVIGLTYSWLGAQLDFSSEARRTLPQMLAVFAAGMTAAVLPGVGRSSQRALIMFAGCALVIWHAAHHQQPFGPQAKRWLGDLPAAVGFAAVVWGCAHGGAAWLARQPLRWLGHISYGVYLWHFPAIYLLRTRGWWPELDLAAATALTALITLPVAALSWHLVEQPILRQVQNGTWRSRWRLPQLRAAFARS